MNNPEGLALVGTTLYVANNGGQDIVTIDLASNTLSSFGNSATPQPVALASIDGGFLVANNQSGVWSYLPGATQSTQQLVTDPNGLIVYAGLVANAAGQALFADAQDSIGCLVLFNYLTGGAPKPYDNDRNCDNGLLNGAVGSAQFSLTSGEPQGMALDPTGAIAYLVDEGNQVIRSIALNVDGGWVTTFAGTPNGGGTDRDGSLSQAVFVYPTAIATDAKGDVFVAEAGAGAVREITDGSVQTIYNSSCGFSEGPDDPLGIAVDAAGQHVYVSDSSVGLWMLSKN